MSKKEAPARDHGGYGEKQRFITSDDEKRVFPMTIIASGKGEDNGFEKIS